MSAVRSHSIKFLAGCCILAIFLLLGSDTVSVVLNNTPPLPARIAASSPQAQTFNGYAYGYGTYYVACRRTIPPNWGDARNWYERAQTSGFAVGTKPARGAIAWTDKGIFGHVAYVEEVVGDRVVVSEMYYNGHWNRVTFRVVQADSFVYIY